MEVKVSIKGPSKRSLLLAVGIVVMLTAAGFLLWHMLKPLPDPFTPDVKHQAATQLYYPTHLPRGYSLDKNAINQPQAGVTIIVIRGKQGRKIYVSEESLPSQIKLPVFYKDFQGATSFTTPSGKATVGTVKDGAKVQKILSLSSYDKKPTWVLMNSSITTPTADMQAIAQKLVPSK